MRQSTEFTRDDNKIIYDLFGMAASIATIALTLNCDVTDLKAYMKNKLGLRLRKEDLTREEAFKEEHLRKEVFGQLEWLPEIDNIIIEGCKNKKPWVMIAIDVTNFTGKLYNRGTIIEQGRRLNAKKIAAEEQQDKPVEVEVEEIKSKRDEKPVLEAGSPSTWGLLTNEPFPDKPPQKPFTMTKRPVEKVYSYRTIFHMSYE